MRIGELAAATGASVRSLRYYEQRGLLTADRSTAGQRTYGQDAPARVALVRMLLDAGLGSRTIADLLPCTITGHADQATLDRLAHERAALAAQAQHLVDTVTKLDEVVAAAARSAHGTGATDSGRTTGGADRTPRGVGRACPS